MTNPFIPNDTEMGLEAGRIQVMNPALPRHQSVGCRSPSAQYLSCWGEKSCIGIFVELSGCVVCMAYAGEVLYNDHVKIGK